MVHLLVLVHPSVVPLFEFLTNFWFLFLKIFQYQRTISFGSFKKIKTKELLTLLINTFLCNIQMDKPHPMNRKWTF